MHVLLFLLANWRVALITTAAVTALTMGVVVYNNVKDSGRQEERSRIERETNDATSRANEAERLVRSCRASGGMWDHAANRCSRP
jgi:hypothetical protein